MSKKYIYLHKVRIIPGVKKQKKNKIFMNKFFLVNDLKERREKV